jgi:flagellin
MPLGVLNNISAVYAENNLNETQASLQNVLTQLSSGSRINSGADDPAGLSISNGLQANAAALSQSSSNASEGAGFLQVADGALSQVTSLLTSAITLATEAGGGTLSASQMGAANQEYQDILTQIGTIGGTTEYNGIAVFSGDQTTSQLTWATGAGSPASSASATAAAVGAGSIIAGGTSAASAPTVTQTYGAAAGITWTGSGAGVNSILTSGAIVPGSKLSGTLTVDADVSGTDDTAISVNLNSVSGSTLAAMATSLQTALNASAGNHDSDFAVSVVGGGLKIALGASAAGDSITKIDAAAGASGSAAPPTGFTMAVTDGGTVSGTIDVTGSGSGTMPSNIVLSNVTTANLQSVVNADLNGSNQNPDYSVQYSAGTLTVSLTGQAATDNITGLVGADDAGSPLVEIMPTTASITFANGDMLGGTFTITPTINGSASNSPVSVNLAGVATANVVSTVDAALGAAADDYTVAYAAGTGKLTIKVNAQGLADGVNSAAIANGSGNNALSQGTSAGSVVSFVNTLMGNFTVTPTTAAGAGSAVNVDLQGVTTANLAASVATALGTNYLVSYAPLTGGLNISVSSAGVAAGVTGFTVAEASQAAASQETPIDGGVDIYTSDGTTTGSQNYNVTVGALSDASVGTSPFASAMGDDITATVGNVVGMGGVAAGAGAGTSLVGTNLNTQADAEAALSTADNAITGIAYMRGQVGANINTLTAASNIASSQMTNITAAENTISATDYAAATSNMSKYEILTQTGISALAQANSTQQMVTKLLQ